MPERTGGNLALARWESSVAVVLRTSQVSGLLMRLHRGDATAQARLIECAAGRLRSLAHSMLRADRLQRWAQIDDLLQQMLVRLNRWLETRQVTTVQAFLRLAGTERRHALIDFARQYFGPLGLGTHHDSQDDRPGGHAERVFVCADRLRISGQVGLQRLYEAIDDLPAEEKEVVDLLWIHDLPQAEAAALLDVSPKTIAPPLGAGPAAAAREPDPISRLTQDAPQDWA